MSGVSILVPVFNHEKFIEQCLNSLVDQITKFSVEIIILDDASTDNTELMINNFLSLNNENSKFIFKYLRNEVNLGLIENIINGFSLITNKYVAICEGDDFWKYNLKLQEQYDILNSSDNIACHFMWYDEFHEETGHTTSSSSDPFPKNIIQELNSVFKGELRIPTRTVMFRKLIIDENLIDDLRKSKYYDLVLNFHYFKRGDVVFTNKVVATYRKHVNGLSSNNFISKVQMRKMKMKIWISTWDNMLIRFGFSNLESYKCGVNKFYSSLFLGNEGLLEKTQIFFIVLVFNIFRPVSCNEKIRLLLYLLKDKNV
jgi:glycosyltransferase involved in cell wall biosynthesis